MESRISGKFVVNGDHIVSAESLADVTGMLMSSLGISRATGRVLELTIVTKTSSDKPWITCPELGYYSTSACGELVQPGTACKATHYHRPAWVTDDSTDPETHVCTECIRFNVEPSRDHNSDAVYNHKNVNPSA